MPSKQRKFGGGKFRSESQRKMMWARFPRAAKDWAHNRSTSKSDWRGGGRAKRNRKTG
jgi:hypothetical protein